MGMSISYSEAVNRRQQVNKSHPTSSFHYALLRNVRVTVLLLRASTCVAQEFIQEAALWALLVITPLRHFSVIGRRSEQGSEEEKCS
jgi:hypothetical protein